MPSRSDSPGQMELPGLSRAERHAVADHYTDIARRFGLASSPVKAQIEAERFRYCGELQRVYECENDGRKYKAPCSCNSRICERCGRRRAKQIERSFVEAVRGFWYGGQKTFGPKFVTLTFQTDRFSEGIPTPAEFRECVAQVRAFVQRFYGKYLSRLGRHGRYYPDRSKWLGAGAVAVPEIGQGNNLHFHLLAYGPFYPQAELSKAWLELTGDSYIMDVRDARYWKTRSGKMRKNRPLDAARYILKYIGKLPAVRSVPMIAGWAWLLKGKRSMIAWGVLYGKVKRATYKAGRKMVCVFCGGELRYRGNGLDPGNLLLDWRMLAKYIDQDRPPPWVREYSALVPGGAPDRRYQLEV